MKLLKLLLLVASAVGCGSHNSKPAAVSVDLPLTQESETEQVRSYYTPCRDGLVLGVKFGLEGSFEYIKMNFADPDCRIHIATVAFIGKFSHEGRIGTLAITDYTQFHTDETLIRVANETKYCGVTTWNATKRSSILDCKTPTPRTLWMKLYRPDTDVIFIATPNIVSAEKAEQNKDFVMYNTLSK